MKFTDGGAYTGEFKFMKYHGKGILINSDGTSYDGGWALGFKHGEGVSSDANGDKYFEEWENGEMISSVQKSN
jgi:hypothetical protein